MASGLRASHGYTFAGWVWASHTLATQLAVSDFTGCGAVSVNWVRNPSVGDVITDWACDEGILAGLYTWCS